MATKNDAPQTKTGDPVLDKAIKRFNESWNYQKDNWHSRWARDNKLYDNERVNAQYYGTVDTFVPMVFSTIETMVSAINNADVRFTFKSGNPIARKSNRAAAALIDEWWENGQWDLLVEEGSREAFITGMFGVFGSWDDDLEQPCFEGYAMRDLIVDPTIKSPAGLQQSALHYAGRRFFVRKGALDDVQTLDADPTSKTFGQMMPRYRKVIADTTNGDKGDDDDKALKEMFSGSTLANSAKDDQDEIIEIWDIDRLVTIQNRKHVREDVVNPHKLRHRLVLEQRYLKEGMAPGEAKMQAEADAKGFVPFFFLRNYRRTSLLYAKSEVDPIAKEQEYLNDMTNMEGDANMKTIAAQRELDPAYKEYIDLIDEDPSTVYPFKPGSLQYIMPPVVTSNAFASRMDIKNEIRETTAIDQVAKGVQNTKTTTATEVQAQMQQSGARIQSKARIFEKDGFFWCGWMLMKFMQLYITEPLVVEISGGSDMTADEAMQKYGLVLPEGCTVFDPADFAEVNTVQVSLDVDKQSKEANERNTLLQAYQIMLQDPSNNLPELKRRLLPKIFPIDQDDLDAIMTRPEQPEVTGAMPGQPMPPQPGMTPEGSQMPVATAQAPMTADVSQEGFNV